jgi:hypothetical protein
MADFRHFIAWHQIMLHMRAHTFAPLAGNAANHLILSDFLAISLTAGDGSRNVRVCSP